MSSITLILLLYSLAWLVTFTLMINYFGLYLNMWLTHRENNQRWKKKNAILQVFLNRKDSKKYLNEFSIICKKGL